METWCRLDSYLHLLFNFKREFDGLFIWKFSLIDRCLCRVLTTDGQSVTSEHHRLDPSIIIVFSHRQLYATCYRIASKYSRMLEKFKVYLRQKGLKQTVWNVAPYDNIHVPSFDIIIDDIWYITGTLWLCAFILSRERATDRKKCAYLKGRFCLKSRVGSRVQLNIVFGV